MKDLLKEGIEIFGFSRRTYNTLLRNRIATVEDLCSLSPSGIKKLYRGGETTVAEVVDKIGRLGLTLKKDETTRKIIYEFSIRDDYKELLFKIREVTVDERPLSFIHRTEYSRSVINKSDIGKVSYSNGKYKMYLLDNNLELYIKAVIKKKAEQIKKLEKDLQEAKADLEKWERAKDDGKS